MGYGGHKIKGHMATGGKSKETIAREKATERARKKALKAAEKASPATVVSKQTTPGDLVSLPIDELEEEMMVEGEEPTLTTRTSPTHPPSVLMTDAGPLKQIVSPVPMAVLKTDAGPLKQSKLSDFLVSSPVSKSLECDAAPNILSIVKTHKCTDWTEN